MMLRDTKTFFRGWLSSPLRVASVVPSGMPLARLITSEIKAAAGHVLEFGPGTGVFTRALLSRGILEEKLVLVEASEEFARLLTRRFPKAAVLRMDAAMIGQAPELRKLSVGAVVSGLPLLNMPPAKVKAIVGAAFEVLAPGAAFYQFTYGPRCPVRRSVLEPLGLQARRIGRVYRNFPPAAVYRIERATGP